MDRYCYRTFSILDIGICHNCCLQLVLKADYSKVVSFSETYQNVLHDQRLVFTHLVITSTLLMIADH